jgi:hypothetical protein
VPRLPRYVPSGRTTPAFAVLALVGIALGAALAWPYQALVVRIPYGALAALVYLIFAFLVGIAGMIATRLGRNRSRALGTLAGALVGIAAIAVSHLLAPDGYHAARLVTGWSLGRVHGVGDLHGDLVWGAWAIEATGVIALAGFTGGRIDPYCEVCQRWIAPREVWLRDDLDARSAAALAHVASIEDALALPAYVLDRPSSARVRYVAHVCPTCASPGYLTLTQQWSVRQEPNDPNNAKTEARHKRLLVQIEISRAQLDLLEARKAEQRARAAAPPI